MKHGFIITSGDPLTVADLAMNAYVEENREGTSFDIILRERHPATTGRRRGSR